MGYVECAGIDYPAISRMCEGFLAVHGKSSPRGVGWFNETLVNSRLLAMLGVIREEDRRRPLRLLDVGCGTGFLVDMIRNKGLVNIDYTGCDLSSSMVEAARSRHPDVSFIVRDLLADSDDGTFD